MQGGDQERIEKARQSIGNRFEGGDQEGIEKAVRITLDWVELRLYSSGLGL